MAFMPAFARPVQAPFPTAGAALPWWMAAGVTPWAAYLPMGAASFAASLLDLTGQGHPAGDPGGAGTPAWDAVNGWTMDGVATYLTTTFVPASDQSQSILIRFTNVTTPNRYMCGETDAGARDWGIIPSIVGLVGYYNGGSAGAAPALLAGRLGIAGAQGYRNGVADGAAIGAWAGATAQATWIGAANGATLCVCRIQVVVIYDVALTGPQYALIDAAVAGL